MVLDKFIWKYLLSKEQTSKLLLTGTKTDSTVAKTEMEVLQVRPNVRTFGYDSKMGKKLSFVKDGILKGVLAGLFETKHTICKCSCYVTSPKLGELSLQFHWATRFIESRLRVDMLTNYNYRDTTWWKHNCNAEKIQILVPLFINTGCAILILFYVPMPLGISIIHCKTGSYRWISRVQLWSMFGVAVWW